MSTPVNNEGYNEVITRITCVRHAYRCDYLQCARAPGPDGANIVANHAYSREIHLFKGEFHLLVGVYPLIVVNSL